MAIGLLLPLRIVQALMCLIVLILSSFVAHWYTYDTLSTSPSQVNFLIFAPLFSLLSIAYLEGVPRFLPRASHPYAHLFLEAANTTFYFSGFVALSVFMSSLLFCRGSVCSAARADAAFAAFAFFAWSASTALLALGMFRKTDGTVILGGGDGVQRIVDEKTMASERMDDVVGMRSESA